MHCIVGAGVFDSTRTERPWANRFGVFLCGVGKTMEDRLIRDKEVLQYIPMSRATWWAGVREGRLPQPVRLGRVTCWRLSDIQKLIAGEVSNG